MGGKQNGMILLLHKTKKQIQDLVPHDRIQAAGSLIQDQKLRMV